jgi:hypothetical protein
MSSSLPTTTPLTEAEIQDLIQKLVAALDKVTDQAKQQQLEKEINALIYRLDNFLVTEETKVRQQVEAQARQDAQVIIDQAAAIMQQAQQQADTMIRQIRIRDELVQYDAALEGLASLFDIDSTATPVRKNVTITTPPISQAPLMNQIQQIIATQANTPRKMPAVMGSIATPSPVPPGKNQLALDQIAQMKKKKAEKEAAALLAQQQAAAAAVSSSSNINTPVPSSGRPNNFLAGLAGAVAAKNANGSVMQTKADAQPFGKSIKEVDDIVARFKPKGAKSIELIHVDQLSDVVMQTLPVDVVEHINSLYKIIDELQLMAQELKFTLFPTTYTIELSRVEKLYDELFSAMSSLTKDEVLPLLSDRQKKQVIVLNQLIDKYSLLVFGHPSRASEIVPIMKKEETQNKEAYEFIKRLLDDQTTAEDALPPGKRKILNHFLSVKQLEPLFFEGGLTTTLKNYFNTMELRAVYYHLNQLAKMEKHKQQVENIGNTLGEMLRKEYSIGFNKNKSYSTPTKASQKKDYPDSYYDDSLNPPEFQDMTTVFKTTSSRMSLQHEDHFERYPQFYTALRNLLDRRDDYIASLNPSAYLPPVKPAKLRGTRVTTTFSS